MIRGGSVRWTDELHPAPPLELSEVQVVVRNSLRHHDVRIDATPPAHWGDRFSVTGRFTQPLLAEGADWKRWRGAARVRCVPGSMWSTAVSRPQPWMSRCARWR